MIKLRGKVVIQSPVALEGELASLMAGVGEIFYVDQVNGNDANFGDQAHPLATITQAHALCADKRGDKVYILPGSYSEQVSITKDFISFIGAMPGGYARPDLEPASLAAFSVHAQGIVAAHMRFVAVDGNPAFLMQGNGFLIDDCVFDNDGGTGSLLQLMGDKNKSHWTASEGIIRNSLIRGSAGAGLEIKNPGAPDAGGDGGVGVTDNVIESCRFYGNAAADILGTLVAGGNGAIFGVVGGECVVRDCDFLTKTKAIYIDLLAGTGAGSITGNRFNHANLVIDATHNIRLDAGILFIGNLDGTGFAS